MLSFIKIALQSVCQKGLQYQGIMKTCQDKEHRSSSRRSSSRHRDSPDCKDNSAILIASKYGDISHRASIAGTNSKQLIGDPRKVKNPAENTQYIRNLYKKYLGKENNHPSDRKTKTDVKEHKAKEKNIVSEACRQKLNYGQQQKPSKTPSFAKTFQQEGNFSSREIASSGSNQLFKKASLEEKNSKIISSTCLNSVQNCYEDLLDKQYLGLLSSKSSIMLAMETINGVRRRCRKN